MEKAQAVSLANEELTRYFTEPRRRYRNVRVVAIVFEEGDEQAEFLAEAKQVEELFSQTFNFTADIFKIPTEDCQLKLKHAISKLLRESGQASSLLILHYGGHGYSTPENEYRLVLAA